MTGSHDQATDTVAGTDGTHVHVPVPHHAALRPAWWLSGASARCNAPPVAADGQRLTPSCRTDRYWESPPAPAPVAVLPVHGGPWARRHSTSRTSGAEPPVTGPLRNGVEWPWR